PGLVDRRLGVNVFFRWALTGKIRVDHHDRPVRVLKRVRALLKPVDRDGAWLDLRGVDGVHRHHPPQTSFSAGSHFSPEAAASCQKRAMASLARRNVSRPKNSLGACALQSGSAKPMRTHGTPSRRSKL